MAKRILLYCDHWQNGGVEAYLMNQLRRWDLSRLHCTLLTAEKTTDIYDAELARLGVRHDVLLAGENTSPIARILHTFSRFENYLRAYPCDVLYLNLSNSVTMRYAKIAKKLGISRRIAHSHCSDVQPGRTRVLKLAGHYLARKCYSSALTDWWACSDKAAAFLFSPRYLKNVVYIPNAIDAEKFRFDPEKRRKTRETLSISETTTVVGTVGRCSPEKNQRFLLEAFALFHKQHPDSRLLIVGDGPLREELEKQAEQLGIADECIFYGFTDDVVPLYCAMDVFCLPSVFEGFGIAAVEAQVSGCKCLVSENLPAQVKITDYIHFLSLEKKRWADEMNGSNHSLAQARTMFLLQEIYDVSKSAAHVQELLLRIMKDGMI